MPKVVYTQAEVCEMLAKHLTECVFASEVTAADIKVVIDTEAQEISIEVSDVELNEN